MTTDFKATQVQTNKIIVTGSFAGDGSNQLLIYNYVADDSGSPNQGQIDPAKFDTSSGIGSDVFLFVSGGVATRGTGASYGVTVMGGDLHVSGNLTVDGTSPGGGGGGGPQYWFGGNDDPLNVRPAGVIITTGSAEITGSLSQGDGAQATGDYSHAEGNLTRAEGGGSHAEGSLTHAVGNYSHAEGLQTLAGGNASHAEGRDSSTQLLGFKVINILPDDAGPQQGIFQLDSSYGNIADSIIALTASNLPNSAYLITDGDINYIGDRRIYAFVSCSFASPHTYITGANFLVSYPNEGPPYLPITPVTGSIIASLAPLSLQLASISPPPDQAITGTIAHAEGIGTFSIGSGSHAEGIGTLAIGTAIGLTAIPLDEIYAPLRAVQGAHAEGLQTVAYGNASHSEGILTYALGVGAHSEGYQTYASGSSSHAEGTQTAALEPSSHAEGYFTFARASQSHTEGYYTETEGFRSHAEGEFSKTGLTAQGSHAEGSSTRVWGEHAHSEGSTTRAGFVGYFASSVTIDGNGLDYVIEVQSIHGDITGTVQSNFNSITYGNRFYTDEHVYEYIATSYDGTNTYITGSALYPHTPTSSTNSIIKIDIDPLEGATKRVGDNSHAEGEGSTSLGYDSHAEGLETIAVGSYSHAEGSKTTALGESSHAEGSGSFAVGKYSHAEGYGTQAIGNGCHTEGVYTVSAGIFSHAEGSGSIAYGSGSHAGGANTIASGTAQTVIGFYNQRNNDFSLFVIGDGTGDADANRSDIVRVNSGSSGGSGIVEVTGSLAVSGTQSVFSQYGGLSYYPNIVTALPYTGTLTDYIIAVSASAGPGVELPGSQFGKAFIVKDVSGSATTDNISVTAAGGALINGSPTYTITSDFGSAQFVYFGPGNGWGTV